MKLTFLQLEAHLKKNLLPIYLICGEETLLMQEAISYIQQVAKSKNFNERVLLTLDGKDWEEAFYSELKDLSLFSTQKIIELHFSGKLNTSQCKALESYATKPASDILLLLSMPVWEKKFEQTKWFKAIEKIGAVINLWPISKEKLPEWIIQRAKKNNLIFTIEAAAFLAELVEGNLLAAKQEIEKLNLYGQEKIDLTTIREISIDNASFDLFDLVDSAISGNLKRALHILSNLQLNGTEPTLILWGLTRELRLLGEIYFQMKHGISLTELFKKFYIWEKRQNSLRLFLKKHSLEKCWELISDAALIDQAIKGAMPGNIWQAFSKLLLKMA